MVVTETQTAAPVPEGTEGVQRNDDLEDGISADGSPSNRDEEIELFLQIGRIFRDDTSGSYILTHHDDVAAFLKDATLLKNPDFAEEAATLVKSFKPDDTYKPGDGDINMMWMDGADHRRVREVTGKALGKRVSGSRDAMEKIVEKHLDRFEGRECVELVSQFCVPVPVEIIAHIFGIEPERYMQFYDWSQSMNKVFRPDKTEADNEERIEAEKGLSAYFERAIWERRKARGDDLLSDLLDAQEAGADISDDEIRVNCVALVVGGNLSTTDLLASTAFLLLKHPEEKQKVLRDPARLGAAVEETLRLETPGIFAQRILPSDMTVGGCPVQKGQVVVVGLATANRDANMFDDPHHFNIDRGAIPHLSFGGGPHACIGATLARIEARIAIGGLLRRYPDMTLARSREPIWRPTPYFRGLDSLWVVRE